ncbi:uncharacterized protein EV154DRAFT_541102 [Mucor mucedo]|uniref:uncharacterized protein n=1 Tax=Mucor mucedo TaxID=29922 RepID=UPI002220899E|nr:uncharacterized protein EV154DRAFT_541102 [Mucor mucedo]KAI7864223.1 hypothetical protein EV154DRAFT_541102 [Mucor mucedo]
MQHSLESWPYDHEKHVHHCSFNLERRWTTQCLYNTKRHLKCGCHALAGEGIKIPTGYTYLPFSLKLGLVPVSLLCIYMVQVQARISFDSYQRLLYFGVAITTLCLASWDKIQTPIQFMYSCFFKRIGGHDQQIYDNSRGSLLRGRQTMLKLCAAQIKEQLATGIMQKKPIWIDLGGGTGWNIETMHAFLPVDSFEKIILVDLTPSLCKVAQERFLKKGWKNVTVLCQDASTFQVPEGSLEGRVGLVTVSYALSMMDDYHPVVDRIQSLLSPEGIIGVVDFYVSGRSSAPAEKWSPQQNRQCNWFTRHFWQAWFELDHIHLGPGRRDYLEYKFGTIKSLNRRNHFIIPYLIQMPYYVWLGCSNARQNELSHLVEIPDDTDSVTSKQSFNIVSRTSFLHQNKQWRVDYNPILPCHTQFRSYIYAFTWEDPRVDLQYLNITSQDVIIALKAHPKRIHCIDMNPCQNHLLELKLASIASLEYKDFWRMFGDGNHPHFSTLLHDIISPHLSSYAFSIGVKTVIDLITSFIRLVYSGLALSILEWWIRMQGLEKDIKTMTSASTIKVQKHIWDTKVRPAIFSPMIQKILITQFPINQMNMFLKECTTQESYFYYLCLNQRYTPTSCPSYLTEYGFNQLKTSGALDSFRLHTESILDSLKSMGDRYLTRLVVMDHMDWFDPTSCQELDDEIREMKRTLKKRWTGTQPWYNELFVKHGFSVEPLGIRCPGQAIDRVNMYASFYRATKV